MTTEPERFFFLRFQKTGGTALALRLRALFGADAIYPRTEDHGHVEAVLWMDYLTSRFEEHRDELRVIAGHFPLCAIDALDAPFRTFTVLRDPVERSLSLLRSRAQRGAERFRGRPLEEIYEDPEIRDIVRNHMVKMLALDRAEMGPLPLTQPMVFDDGRLAVAKQRLEGIEVIGIQERYAEFCDALEARFGWDLAPDRRANQTQGQPVSESLRRRLAEDNAMDVELYEHAQHLIGPPRPTRSMPTNGAPKIVITGTGRAGTTLLVQILDELGLDTGLSEGKLSPYGASARAGLEALVDDPEAPTVVKDMTLGWRLRELLEAGTVDIAHVILPDRRLEVAAASRIRVADYGRRPFGRGSLTGTLKATEQVTVLANIRAEILSALDDFSVPYTIVEFPRFASDAVYTHAALAPILEGATVEDVQRALDRCVRPELIHEAPLSRRERWRTRLTTGWMVVYRYPIARIRGRVNPDAQQAKIRASVAAARKQEAALAEDAPAPGDHQG
jgi:hypothetical protein